MFDARKGQITITRGDTGLLAIVPTGYVPTSQDRMFFMVAEMPDGRIVINKTVTPDDDGICKLMFSGTDTENLSKRHREYTYAIRFALDVTESVRLFGSGGEIAERIRRVVKEELRLTVSVGVSFNKVFAKLASEMKKPDAVTVISRENYREKV